MLLKSCFENFPKLTGKYLCWSNFLINLKRDTRASIFLCILQILKKFSFCRTPLSDFFCLIHYFFHWKIHSNSQIWMNLLSLTCKFCIGYFEFSGNTLYLRNLIQRWWIVVTRCHPLPLFLPATCCHSLFHLLSFVIICCTTLAVARCQSMYYSSVFI